MPITSVRFMRPAAIASSAAQMAVEPVAQAFSVRTAGVCRNSGIATAGREAVKSWPTKPALTWPTKMPSMSLGSRPALSSAGCTASRIICSRSSLSSLPKGVWPQPMMYELLTSILCKDVEGNQSAKRVRRHRTARAAAPGVASGLQQRALDEPAADQPRRFLEQLGLARVVVRRALDDPERLVGRRGGFEQHLRMRLRHSVVST